MTTPDRASPEYWDPRIRFGTDDYLGINAARLEHLGALLDQLGLDPAGLSVIELGAGIGDHSLFWRDRGAKLTITEAREENLAVLRARFPDADIRRYDVDRDPVPDGTFDIVYCYGLLYHLADPARGIAAMGALARRFAFLETCVSYGDQLDQCRVEENVLDPTQSFHGGACRPTRPWLVTELAKAFPHVYLPATQPDHPQFPLNWRKRAPDAGLTRSIFVAARAPVRVAGLFDQLPMRQVAHEPARAEGGEDAGMPRLVRALGIAAVIEVGSDGGQFGRSLRDAGFNGQIVTFEPLREARDVLAAAGDDSGRQLIDHALGRAQGEQRMLISADLLGSGFERHTPRVLAAAPLRRSVLRRRVRVRRLDAVWPDLPDAARTRPLLLKLDANGAERAVLAGAQGVLDRIDAVLLGCSLMPVVGGELLLGEAPELMRGLGFHPVHVAPSWSDPATGETYRADVLFTRSPDVAQPNDSAATTS